MGTAGEVKLSTGTLRYVQRESSAWTWSVVWQPQSVFVSAADATHLQQHIAAGGTLDATLRRVVRANQWLLVARARARVWRTCLVIGSCMCMCMYCPYLPCAVDGAGGRR
ncbi:MAG: hypothetical protein EOO65_02985 [Methanosarcinales archaeon]|nr:MAG: hypothetical protein EOO65_02985 [Methanosarcinales archaeon]